MIMTYSRKATITKRWDVVTECWRYQNVVVLTIKCDGKPVGTLSKTITWPEARKWVGRKWHDAWQVDLPGRRDTISAMRNRDAALAEVKRYLTQSAGARPAQNNSRGREENACA